MIPPEKNAEFVCRMEKVLDTYRRCYDPKYPVICIDEKLKQLVKETIESIPAQPGQENRQDYHYERNGTANLFMVCNPMLGWRKVKVTQRRTAQDFAYLLRDLADKWCPEACLITLVLDQLNTHSPASLYQTFPPEEAHRIMKRFEFCYTPKHGSWLNMAEIELSIVARQCLDRRIPDFETLTQDVELWTEERNQRDTWIDWRFTTDDARIKLKRLYPSI